MKHFITGFPPIGTLTEETKDLCYDEYREANCHIHTPYSFSAFKGMDEIFRMAVRENITVLGINDFYVTDGYDAFHKGCVENGIFPLFNIEFIGLLKDEQKRGIRINDPNNPGRIYFCGKGLDYPFHTDFFSGMRLKNVIRENQNQIRAMIAKINSLIFKQGLDMKLSYEAIKKEYAEGLVMERHIVKAVRLLIEKYFTVKEEQINFIEKLWGEKKSEFASGLPADFENEIRSKLLKNGRPAFIEENEKSFLKLEKIINIIVRAGGIPCYPVLLDDYHGKYTEFESEPVKLLKSLQKLNIGCIELIPGRNDLSILKNFVEFFHANGFIIILGTEHNTPEMAPLSISAKGKTPLDGTLKKIAWEGACVIAAHQYLRINGMQGCATHNSRIIAKQRQELARLGQRVIEYFINANKRQNET
ncbi:MAG: hypothetical protein LBV47_09605 [Bacteroidales bacterium]|jgi:hypothetical protein|nr:hypothetical protein [Bacteroidales bacterium]